MDGEWIVAFFDKNMKLKIYENSIAIPDKC